MNCSIASVEATALERLDGGDAVVQVVVGDDVMVGGPCQHRGLSLPSHRESPMTQTPVSLLERLRVRAGANRSSGRERPKQR